MFSFYYSCISTTDEPFHTFNGVDLLTSIASNTKIKTKSNNAKNDFFLLKLFEKNIQ